VEASRTPADQVADLRALLDAAGVGGPFVIGAHSYGANVAILFTQAYPDDVVGLLFVDPQSPRVGERFLDALPAPAADQPASVAEFRDGLETFNDDPSLNPEHLHLWPSFTEAAAALDAPGPLFGERPVVVLSAETSRVPRWDCHLNSRRRSTISGPRPSRSSRTSRPRAGGTAHVLTWGRFPGTTSLTRSAP
jgi:pimeloyl-ACP methyl ester carboxylesterase